MPTSPCKSGGGLPGGLSMTKLWINLAVTRNSWVLANDSPRHTRRPAPNGRKLLTPDAIYLPDLSMNLKKGARRLKATATDWEQCEAQVRTNSHRDRINKYRSGVLASLSVIRALRLARS